MSGNWLVLVAIPLWRPGRRLFSIAAILMRLTALAHTAGHLAPVEDPALKRLVSSMANYHLPMGLGMSPSVLDIQNSLSLTMTITFLALAGLNLLLAGSAETPGRLLRGVVWLNVVWVAGFLVLNYTSRILPPLICAAIIEVLLLASLFSPGYIAPSSAEGP